MSTEPSTLRTANQLFDSPQCTHIITMNNPNQNLHLERMTNGFRFTAGSPGVERHHSREYDSLDDVDGEMALTRLSVRDAIWQDISDFRAFPYSVLYLTLKRPIELRILPDSEHMTAYGPHTIYGLVDISASTPGAYLITATGVRGILRPTRNTLERLRLKYENYRLRHDTREWAQVKPGVIVVYGKLPTDWQTMSQSLTAAQPASLQ